MHPLPSLKQLQYLLALADHGSFSAAASACNVTQSTLSAGIATLEELLGQKLADRSQRQVVLTATGMETVAQARPLLQAASDLVARARRQDAPLSGPLRLGIIPTIAPYLLPVILPDIKERFPGLDLQLREETSSRLAAALKAGQIDLALLAFPYDTPGMTQTRLTDEAFLLACPKGYWRGPRPPGTSDLEGHEILLLEEGHCLRDHALDACRLPAPGARGTFSATSLATLIQMIGHGYGVTLLPAMAADAVPDTVELIPFAAPAPSRAVGLAWRKGHPKEDDFRLLADTITSLMEK